MKYRDEILQLPLRLSANIMEGRLEILETFTKSEKITSFYPIVLCILQTFSTITIMLSRTGMILISLNTYN